MRRCFIHRNAGIFLLLFCLLFAPAFAEETEEEAYTGITPTPVFSETALYPAEPFSLALSCSDPAAVIYYTLDGSAPDTGSPVYTQPLPVSASCTVRAFAKKDGALDSETVTVTYLFTEKHTLPVVCLAMAPERVKKLYNTNYKNNFPETEASFAYYEADGTLGTSFTAGITMRGNASTYYTQKSLTVHLRKKYGQGSVTYPFWEEGGWEECSALVLRSGSQDRDCARLRDSFANRAAAGLHLDTVMTRPVILYINGDYYGIHDLNECMNKDYFAARYGIDADAVNIVFGNDTVRTGSGETLAKIRKYARSGNFKKDSTLQELSQWVDIESVTDYLIAQTFFGNYDLSNQLYFGTADCSVKWRPCLYDVDRCFVTGRAEQDLFKSYFNKKGITIGAHNVYINMDIISALKDNEAWCEVFLQRYAELLRTDFSAERLKTLLYEMADALRPEMERHIQRWKLPASVEKWEGYIEDMAQEIDKKHSAIGKMLMETFSLSGAEWNALSESGD